MQLIICNIKQKVFFEKLITYLKFESEVIYKFACCATELKSILLSTNHHLNKIIIEVSLDWEGKHLQDFYGFDIAKSLRRDYFVTNPIIFVSNLRKNYFEKFSNKFGIINAEGSGFVSFPFSLEELNKELTETSFLTNAELKILVQSQCDFHKTLEILVHKIAGLLVNQDYQYEKVVELSDDLAKTINFFAPQFKAQLQDFQKRLASKSSSYLLNESLQNLGDALKGKTAQTNWKDEFRKLPKCPPKGYSKILIADDEPLPFLMSVLQNEFYYEVVEQAMNLKDAEKLLEKEKPSIVLSDYYYKKSRFDRKPDKDVGSAFMKKALGFEVGTQNESKKPIVAVISKVPLDPLNEIRTGVLDCSGPLYATSAEFIHYQIWQEAKRRGVNETEKIGGQELTSEMRCRQRIESFVNEIPKIILQWDFFKETVKETLSLIKEVQCSKKSEDINIINSIIKTLKPFSMARDFSLNQVLNIFSHIEIDHTKAREIPSSEVKSEIRDILHGKIEQFSKVINSIESARRIVAEVAEDLVGLTEFADKGQQLKEAVGNFDENKDILPYLESLNVAVKETVENLPNLPINPTKLKLKTSYFPKYNIISIEDDKYWAFTVKTAVEKLLERLDGLVEINYQYFDNTAEVLDKLSQISNSGRDNEVKTIAIVDICLPKERNQKPQRRNGIELLNKLSEYSANFPKLVFSTKTSLEDILDLGKVGIPNRNFIAKDNDAEDSIIQRLSEIIQKQEKHTARITSDLDNDKTPVRVFINNLHIDFADELNFTFHALSELTYDDFEEKYHFTAQDIYLKRNILQGEEKVFLPDNFKRKIQNDIYEIREFIFKIFQDNNLYIDVKDLIKTIIDEDLEESYYELNADLSFNDNEDEDEDELTSYNVLVIQEEKIIRDKIVDNIRKILNVERIESFANNADDILAELLPDIICISFANIGYITKIKTALPNHKFGILVTATRNEKDEKGLIQQAVKLDVPLTSFISLTENDWENTLITKFDNEKRRVFYSEIITSKKNFTEPIIEVLSESNLAKGILRLEVNNNVFSMNKSNISKIIGYLLLNPKKLINLETLKRDALGDNSSITDDEQKGWTRRIRNKIQSDWLKTDDREIVKNILESSSEGMKLNVQLINSRPKE